MTWRRVPPVWSPVALRSLVPGLGAAFGTLRADRDALATAVSKTFDARHTVLTDSGTSALVLAMRALAPRGTVALPAYACIDLIAAAQRANVQVRLYDVDPQTLSPDPDSLRRAASAGVDAILVAPLYGYPVDMRTVTAIAASHGVPVIEDAAQGAGSTLDGRRVGSLGDVSILSFGRGKGTTGGSGGALLVHNAAYVTQCRDAGAMLQPALGGVREVIALAAQWKLARPMLYVVPSSIPALKLGEMVYHAAPEPRAISGAATRILPFALAADADEVRVRRARGDALMHAMSSAEMPFAPVRPVAGASPGYLRFAVLDTVGTAHAAPALGALRGYPVTLDEHAETASVLARGESAGPGARTLRDRLFTVPTHSRASAKDIDRLIAWLGARAVPGAA